MKYKDNERAYHREYQKTRYAANPEKARAYQREWKKRKYAEDPSYREKVLARNKERVKARTAGYKLLTRLKRYNLSFHDYAVMYAKQYGLCGICERPFDKFFDRTLNIDHDHVTNQVRGLLCSDCNTSLGKFGDNLEGIMRVVRYLEGNK